MVLRSSYTEGGTEGSERRGDDGRAGRADVRRGGRGGRGAERTPGRARMHPRLTDGAVQRLRSGTTGRGEGERGDGERGEGRARRRRARSGGASRAREPGPRAETPGPGMGRGPGARLTPSSRATTVGADASARHVRGRARGPRCTPTRGSYRRLTPAPKTTAPTRGLHPRLTPSSRATTARRGCIRALRIPRIPDVRGGPTALVARPPRPTYGAGQWPSARPPRPNPSRATDGTRGDLRARAGRRSFRGRRRSW